MVILGRVVLHDYHATILDVIEDSAIVRLEIFAHGVSSHTQHDGVEFRKISASQIIRGQEVHVDTEIDQRLRHIVTGADNISDVEAGDDVPQSLVNLGINVHFL